MPESKRALKVFLCHAHSDAPAVPQGDDMRALYNRLVTLAPDASAGEDGVDEDYNKAW